MRSETYMKPALTQHIKNALRSVASLLFGVNEVLFLAGMAMLFSGLSGLWSRDGALAVCGGVLVIVGVWGAVAQSRKGGKA